MKKTLSTLFFCFVTLIVKAQYYNGYYLNTADKRIDGLIAIETYEDHLFFKADTSASRSRINVHDIKMVVINSKKSTDTLIVKIDSESVDNKEPYFAMLYLNTPVKLYKRFKKARTFGAPGGMGMPGGAGIITGGLAIGLTFTTSGDFDVMFEQNGITSKLTRKNFKTIMSVVTKEFPSLAKQTQDGTYGVGDIDTIVAVYYKLKQMKAEGKVVDN